MVIPNAAQRNEESLEPFAIEWFQGFFAFGSE
jgi:hypothetical protein